MTNKIKVLLLSRYSRIGASSRLRSLQYFPYLESHGLAVTVKPLFDDEYLSQIYEHNHKSPAKIAGLFGKRLVSLFAASSYDLIWIEKEIWPHLPAFAERILHLFGKPYVVDFDDAVFHNYDLSGNVLVRRLLGRKIDAVMRHSACVVAGNAYLADRARAAGAPRIEVVPTVVDYTRYVPRRHEVGSRPVIGWIGSPSTQKYVVKIRDALAKVCRAHDARLMLVGATPQVVNELPGLDVEVVPWSEDSEAELIGRMDVGIMPLPDGPWEKGKCGYKLIQYMACAVPVVASPVGVNVKIVTTSLSGILATSASEWETSLHQLLVSHELRNTMGSAGRMAVEKYYSLQVQAPVLARLFTEITKF